MTTREMIAARVAAGSKICVGLDPDRTKLPDCLKGKTEAARVVEFLTGIVDRTAVSACAFKPQIAFFEALGAKGHKTLHSVIKHIRDVDPTISVLLDYKRADIGNTNAGYVDLAYNYLGVDGVTLHPYFGAEAMRPFLSQEGKLSIVLCRTSNAGAGEMQDVLCSPLLQVSTGLLYASKEVAKKQGATGPFKRVYMTYYQYVARMVVQNWKPIGDCAVVVGATYAEELKLVRQIIGDMPMLVPGLGSQGGKITDVIPGGLDSSGFGVILNNASAINFAFNRITNPNGDLRFKPKHFAKAAGVAARQMNKDVNQSLLALAA